MENRLESGVRHVMHVTTQCDEPHKRGSAMVDEVLLNQLINW